MKRKDLINK